MSDIALQRKEGFLLRKDKYVVPQEARVPVIEFFHDTTIGGHGGIHKTIDLIRRIFWWPGMNTNIREYIVHCPICIQAKTLRTSPQGLLQPLPVPSSPWKDIAMDFITDLPMSSNHNTLMIIIDRFSKMAHFIPIKHLPTASETATLFIKHIFSLHGLPESITTDRGTQFTSHFWKAFCKGLHIQSNLSTAFHPQTNGQTERVNGILEQYLRCYITHLQDNWLQYIPIAEFVYNNQKQSATKYSPFFINYGRHPVMLPGAPINSDTPTTDQRIKDILHNYKIIRDNLHHAQLRYKVYADQKRSPSPTYALGDNVWLDTTHIRLHCPSRKLGPKFIGPFPITKIISPTAVQLSLPDSYKIHPVFHVS
uniref:Gypsy retrotransposon integrase-like protein 1 n=1 Tax=Leptobrachium leishanense TaxID=445787 RepID=A0A8C5LTP9_9ANUR